MKQLYTPLAASNEQCPICLELPRFHNRTKVSALLDNRTEYINLGFGFVSEPEIVVNSSSAAAVVAMAVKVLNLIYFHFWLLLPLSQLAVVFVFVWVS